MKTKDNGAALALAAVAALALGALAQARHRSAPRGAPESSRAKPAESSRGSQVHPWLDLPASSTPKHRYRS
jgi:hypothetical protein